MMEILKSINDLLISIVEFLGKKEVIGIAIGALGTIFWYRITRVIDQKEKNKMVLLQIEGNIKKNIEVAKYNIGVVNNELSKLPKFTLNPLNEFFAPSSDLLIITSSLDCEKSLELWDSLKQIEILKNRIQFLMSETFVLRRMIKAETEVEIYNMELLPYLKQLDTMLIIALEEIEKENHQALKLLIKLRSFSSLLSKSE
ncbi:hypothetical protein [Shewanella sp. UCD-KL12]|uniref:hypothetical protein n=1 Tax=Shewanella sp. UCD-KL12 TaxID=1917163 RepID=UPI00097034F7|nr:hypothetical protein [Shewanella sp. UCD-KL12]